MKEFLIQTFVTTLYLLALINPISKVSILSVLSTDQRREEFRAVTAKSSLVALGVLLCSMIFGSFVLRSIFHVEIHSLRLAGGVILCWVGFNALRRGIFFEQEVKNSFEDIALVPLACPMIAGPATIAACIAIRAKNGLLSPALSVLLAIGINYCIMRLSRQISSLLLQFNILGALVRLTGLIVMTIGTQMALDGLSAWLIPLFA
ncbi:MarC family protein [Verrucomicrobiota bacterium]